MYILADGQVQRWLILNDTNKLFELAWKGQCEAGQEVLSLVSALKFELGLGDGNRDLENEMAWGVQTQSSRVLELSKTLRVSPSDYGPRQIRHSMLSLASNGCAEESHLICCCIAHKGCWRYLPRMKAASVRRFARYFQERMSTVHLEGFQEVSQCRGGSLHPMHRDSAFRIAALGKDREASPCAHLTMDEIRPCGRIGQAVNFHCQSYDMWLDDVHDV